MAGNTEEAVSRVQAEAVNTQGIQENNENEWVKSK